MTIGIETAGLVALPLAIWLLPARFDLTAAILTFAGGAAGGLGLILFYRAMTLHLIGVVAPVSAVVAAALPVAVGLSAGERLRVWQLVGIAVGLDAIALINAAARTATAGARMAI